ncbi:hypothetical protein Slin15195_G072600 [Septoria linicola]|uniref:Uncharacterized protein n=1 Tax=Septoria linicola TaxID=215465 RepID=A0A9Q9EJN0_9PEZI|nr:hypothetical protein Slin15195_G072600 [Septoria linicola]
MSIPTDTSQRTPAAYEQNGELDSEDDDPWSDPWMSTCSARGSNSKVAHAASSVYSAHSSSLQNESQPTQMEPTAHTVAHDRPVDYDACHYMDHISLADSPPPRQSGVASKHNSFAAKIRAALRLSHQESDDDSDLSEPTLPPPAHFAASQSTSPACQLDSGRTRRVAPRDHKSSFTTTPPHAQSATSKFLLSHQKMRGLDQAVLSGMRAPYWTPASSTPEDTYHQFGRRPRIKHEKMLFDIDVDKNHFVLPCRAQVSTTRYRSRQSDQKVKADPGLRTDADCLYLLRLTTCIRHFHGGICVRTSWQQTFGD